MNGFNKWQEMFKRHVKMVGLCLLMAFVLEMILISLSTGGNIYTLNGEPFGMFPSKSARLINCIYENGRFIVAGDAQLIMDTAEAGEIREVCLTFEHPLSEPMFYQVFYDSGAEGYPFSERAAVFGVLAPGETQSIVKIPAKAHRSLRVDFYEDCDLVSIAGSAQAYVSKPLPASDFGFRPARLVMVFAVLALGLWGVRRMMRAIRIPAIHLRKVIFSAMLMGAAAAASIALYHVLWFFGFPASAKIKVFCVVVSMTAAAAVLLRGTLAERPQIVFLLIALVAGGMMILNLESQIINSWDEDAHMNSAIRVSYLLDTLEITTRELWAIPSGVMIALGRLFKLSMDMTMRLGKLGNLLFYALTGYAAISRLKSGRMILCVLLLAPTNLLMASSYSYDPCVTSMTMLGLSVFFAQWQKPEEKIKFRDALLMIGAMMLGCASKEIYFLLILMLLFMPESKFDSRKMRNIYRAAVVLAALCMLLTFALPFLGDMGTQSDMRGGSDVNAGGQVRYILTHPVEYAMTLGRFLTGYLAPRAAKGFLTLMGVRETAPNFELLLLLLAYAACTDRRKEDNAILLRKPIVACAHVLLAMTVVLFSTALYVAFTAVGAKTIAGCQVRYLMPVIFPSLYLLGSAKSDFGMERGLYHGLILLGAGYAAFGAVLCGVIA